MKKLNFEDYMEKFDLKNTMVAREIQRIYNYCIYPRESKLYSDRGFVNIDIGSQGGTHWTCFIIKNNKSFYFDSYGGAPDKFLSNQLPKPKIYCNLKKRYKFKIMWLLLFVLFLFN